MRAITSTNSLREGGLTSSFDNSVAIGLMSIPMNLRFLSTASFPIRPKPTKGSRTTSSFNVKFSMRYDRDMEAFFSDALRVLYNGGILAIVFNAYDSGSWEFLKSIQNKCDSVEFRGCFPMAYSAGSVVQDNRKGALKYDYVLIYEKCSNGRAVHGRWKKLADLDGWSCSLPKKAT